MRVLALAALTAIAISSTNANALGISNECAPEISAKVSGTQGKEDRYNGWEKQNDYSFSIGIKWKFGLGDSCDQLNRHRIATQRERADQERTESMSDKIKVCKSFDPDTAPPSIRTFCGDLLQYRR